jgi:hypothetical protein
MFNWGRRWYHRRAQGLSRGPSTGNNDAVERFDTEVDVLCVGSGPAVLGAAISAADAGMTVLVAECRHAGRRADRSARPRTWASALRAAWSEERLSDATMAYLHALTDDAGPPGSSPEPCAVNLRRVDDPMNRSRTSSGTVAPFFGANLLRWTRTCLSSPYGVLYSRISIPGATEYVQASGERLEISNLVSPPRNPLEMSLSAWLLTRAREKGVEMRTVGPLRRLVFDDHEVVGAVFGDGPGSFTVRARHGVALATSDRGTVDSALSDAWQSTNSGLGVVSAVASHFGRLELLTNLPAQSSISTTPEGGYRSSRKMIPS